MMQRAAWLIYVLAWSGLLFWATVASAAPRVFWWFDNPYDNPGPHATQIAEVAAHSTHTMSVRYWEPDDWRAARTAGLRVAVMLPGEIFWAVRDTAPSVPSLDLPMRCLGPVWCQKTLADWVTVMQAQRDLVDVVLIADEVDCNSDDGTIRFPNWTPASCQRAAAKLTVLHQTIKTWLPWVQTWTNHTSAWVYYYVVARDQRVPVSRYGVSTAPSDLVSFDCYQPFDRCFGRTSVSQLAEVWLQALRPEQSIALLPRAFLGPYLGWNPAVPELATMADQYWQYAQQQPRVTAIVPFIYRGLGGARSVPDLLAIYAAQGARVKPSGVPPRAPLNLRFVRE
jgi:hypothetical protein